MKQLVLSQIYNPDYNNTEGPLNDPERYVYKVEKVTNSTTPQIAWPHLSVELVEVYCNDENWNVTITSSWAMRSPGR